MRARMIASVAIVLALGFPAVAAAPVPRQAPEITILDRTGQETTLSSFKGQVVVIEFLLIRCGGCLRMAQTINKLHSEMAGRGFQPIGIVFDDGVNEPVVRDLVQLLKLNYTVGFATADDVDRYLGREITERLQVPQVVVIDRAGVIRAQSRPTGEANLTDENYLRNLVRELLDGGTPPGKSEQSAVPPEPSN